jgi:hypothetical protein
MWRNLCASGRSRNGQTNTGANTVTSRRADPPNRPGYFRHRRLWKPRQALVAVRSTSRVVVGAQAEKSIVPRYRTCLSVKTQSRACAGGRSKTARWTAAMRVKRSFQNQEGTQWNRGVWPVPPAQAGCWSRPGQVPRITRSGGGGSRTFRCQQAGPPWRQGRGALSAAVAGSRGRAHRPARARCAISAGLE